MKNLEKLSKVKYITSIEKKKINLKLIKDGINCLDEFIILKENSNFSIYDRVCNHKGGKIISKNGKHFCPIHNWEFFPKTGVYKNGFIKRKIDYKLKKNHLEIINKINEPEILSKNKNLNITVKYINHAFLIIESENFKFAIDPWAIGPAFNTGWWLKHQTIKNWQEELNQCDFILISHNHPDHLHELTLSKINKNINILVPKFISDSTGLMIQELGFKNVERLEFEIQYKLKKTDLYFVIFKSGDLREDSGLYFSIGNFTGLLTVDANNLNFLKLPKVDFFASSFAGGASGYPLNCENYSLSEKKKIVSKHINFIKRNKEKYLKYIKPKFFLPYAGFFCEKLPRDIFFKKYNNKNKINDYKISCKNLNIDLFNVEESSIFNFNGSNLISKLNNKKKYYQDINKNDYLKYYKKNYQKLDLKFIKDYFLKSNFNSDLVLLISISSENFDKSYQNFKIDFRKEIIKFKLIKNSSIKKITQNKKIKSLYLKIRKESFLNTIYNKRPWEDISIGFQCRQYRNPNIYNDKFWFHFSNNYVGKKYVKSITNCSNCIKLDQYFDNLIFS